MRSSLTSARFFALPLELRHEVYRKLLVQPCKFDLRHKDTCNDHEKVYSIRPGPGYVATDCCANCQTNGYCEPQAPIFKSPFRSKWARPHTNVYLCDNCYWDVAGRIHNNPCLKSLRCLCTRRTNLDVLLIDKRFHGEAAPIFWSENTFAFEYPHLLVGFLRAIRPQVRSWLRRISFMPSHPRVLHDDTTVMGSRWSGPRNNELVDPWGWDEIGVCWELLRQCEGLTWLELDVYCLQRLKWALLIRLIHVNGLVIFSRRPGDNEIIAKYADNSSRLWLSIGRRKPVDTPTTRLMVASMTKSRNMKSKTLKRHYFETGLHDIYGGDIYPNEDSDNDDW